MVNLWIKFKYHTKAGSAKYLKNMINWSHFYQLLLKLWAFVIILISVKNFTPWIKGSTGIQIESVDWFSKFLILKIQQDFNRLLKCLSIFFIFKFRTSSQSAKNNKHERHTATKLPYCNRFVIVQTSFVKICLLGDY